MKIQISESGYNDLYEGATYGTFSTFKLMDNRENLEDALSFCSLQIIINILLEFCIQLLIPLRPNGKNTVRKVMPVSYTPLLFRQNSPK
jgi:hypothetical protein